MAKKFKTEFPGMYDANKWNTFQMIRDLKEKALHLEVGTSTPELQREKDKLEVLNYVYPNLQDEDQDYGGY